MKINYQIFEKKINIKFKNRDLLAQSLTHKSFDSKTNNEKLEFLGDRVLGLVIAKKLLEIYPNEKEGILDKKFASLVNKNTCLEIAKNIKLENFIQTFNPKNKLIKIEDKIISDCCEALVGAIYLEKGFGIVGVLNKQSNLLGIITDGDLRRNMDTLLDMSAEEVMTINPQVIESKSFLVEALEIMNSKKITCLFVVEENKPIGIIHIHDCLRAGIKQK